MKGLLTKDFKLLFSQKNFFISMMFIVVFNLFLQPDPSFVVTYTGMVMLFIAMSSISYDEFDNGYAFLFTLPITKKLYVCEKYLLTFLTAVFGWILSAALLLGSGLVKEVIFPTEAYLAVILFSLLMMSLFLPIQLKFGAEKMKTVFFLFGGGIAVVVVLAVKVGKYFNLDLSSLLHTVSSWGAGTLIGFGAGAVLIALFVSFRTSVSIMERKEF